MQEPVMLFSKHHIVSSLVIYFYFISMNGVTAGSKVFPANFMFGVGSSAYQTEGSRSDDGKGDNIWDNYISTSSGNSTYISNDSYEKYKEDVALIAKMKLKFYKFSLSWTRILPSGFNDSINEMGVNYYKNLIQELETHNITPIVTIYHWDLPQSIQKLGGWTNTSNIQFFVDYARVVFQSFGTVKYWLTMHEPKQICRGGYGDGSLAPFISESGVLDYQCAYVVLKAHAAVYRMYRTEFPNAGGKMSIALDGSWSVPARNTSTDQTAVNRRHQFEFGFYANPIFVNGDWPNTVKQIVNPGNKGDSRLPTFTKEELAQIRGSADFLALNYYEARMVQYVRSKSNGSIPSYEQDMRMNISKNSTWAEGANGFTIVPWSIRSFLNWTKREYRNPEIIITGNGVADDGSLQDTLRINYMADYLSNILDAIHIDKVNVTGYIFWSLLDSFEWTNGYNIHFGLYSVDRNSTERTRIAKDSSEFYRRIATEYKIPVTTDTTTFSTISTTGSIDDDSSNSDSDRTDKTTTTKLSTSTDAGTTPTFTEPTTHSSDIVSTKSTTSSLVVTTTTFSGSSTVILCSFILLAVSIMLSLFYSNGFHMIYSLSKGSEKIV
ncbi:unnamed protein product [Phaedon cochleariae]|uniref:Glycosyl hydrolase n=1 Tax=Phaedon cochleariae TaxID=80249 RepID=A0A9N9X2H0_PHACE|nr:unnamed protein product [Phaedon cochleariae]